MGDSTGHPSAFAPPVLAAIDLAGAGGFREYLRVYHPGLNKTRRRGVPAAAPACGRPVSGPAHRHGAVQTKQKDSGEVRPVILLVLATSPLGCQHLHWPHGSVLPPAEATAACQPAGVCPAPYDPCLDPCYTGEYILMEPGAAYVVPGGAPQSAPMPAFPNATQPLPPPAAAPTELPGWFDVLPRGGGAISPDFGLPVGPVVEDRLPNPLVIPIANGELAWDQLADVVSTYFPILREQQVQLTDGVLTEGFLETPPQPAATLLEPHRKDSAGAFNRIQATFQTIRRRAFVRVTPTAGGWAIEPQVFKELEDLPRPEEASAGAASIRSDNALPSERAPDEIDATRDSPHWIPLGRDEPLEQKMLREIQARLTTGQ